MRWLSMLLLLPALAMAGMPPAPAPLEISTDELAALADRDVAIRFDASDGGGTSIGIIDVAAPPAQAMDAILDLPPRVAETGALKKVDVYEHLPASGNEPEKLSAQFSLKVVGSSIVFHVNYQIDRPGLWAVSVLDETRENDIISAYSSYQVFATPTGSRIVYRTRSESGRSVPGWIKTWLANSALKDQLRGIRARAEGA